MPPQEGVLIFLDDRGGSSGRKDIIEKLQTPLRAMGLKVELTRLESADVAFGSKDGYDIGLELKRLDGGSTDLIQSLRSGRLSGHQIPRMLGPKGAYDYGYLLIEGAYQHDDNGCITVYQGKKKGWVAARGSMTMSELDKRLLTLELNYDRLYIKNLLTRRDTIRFISNCYRHWTDKSLAQHTSHQMVHDAPTIIPVSDFRATVMRFPGVGYRLSSVVETHFRGSLRQAVCAGVDEWAGIASLSDEGKSRKLGMKAASQIVAFCRGGL